METLATQDIWKQIPPEEKLHMMANAHSAGMFAAVGYIVVLATLAVGFHQPWIFWLALLSAPVVFQFNSGRAWRALRPRAMLEHLAARTAARRYAFMVKGDDLSVRLVFRARLEHMFESEDLLEELDAAFENDKFHEVWVSLFGDSIIMISERPGGAELQFGCLLDAEFSIVAESRDGRDYSSNKSLIISHTDKKLGKRTVRIESPYPAALIVFEKKALQQQAELADHFASLQGGDLPPVNPPV